MGSLKSFIAAAALLSAPAAAFAADLLPPHPPLPEAVPLVEIGTGWYLRGDAGYINHSEPKEELYGRQGAPLVGLRFDDTWSAGGGIGYKFNGWLRADVTADHRIETDFETKSSRTNFVEGYNLETGRFDSTTVLVNGYVDLGTWYGVTPYIGAGVGFAETRLKDYASETTCLTVRCGDPHGFYRLGPQGQVPRPHKTAHNFAWALTAGLGFELAQGFTLDAGYRYVNLGEALTGIDAFGFGTKLEEVEAHEVRLGLRYLFAGTGFGAKSHGHGYTAPLGKY